MKYSWILLFLFLSACSTESYTPPPVDDCQTCGPPVVIPPPPPPPPPPAPPPIVVTPPPPVPACVATLHWELPYEREDGSAMTDQDYATAHIFIGATPLAVDEWVAIIEVPPLILAYHVENGIMRDDDSNFFSMTVTDVDGQESVHSNEIEKVCD